MMRAHVHMHAGNTSKKVFKYYVDNSVRDGNGKEWQAENEWIVILEEAQVLQFLIEL